MPHAVLNGRDVSLPDAPTLADALRAIGVHLPALCHDERLEPTGACRLCLVRLNGAARPVPACVTPITEGMTIDTSSPDLEAARRGTLQMLAAGYPAEAARADPEKPFHQEIANHRLGDAEMAGVRTGDLVRLVSRYGSATLPIRVTPAIRPGELFATFHTVDTFLNNITSSERDRTVGTPEFKVTAVQIERV